MFKSFVPSEDIIRKMAIDKFINSKNKEESELGLDFATFLLRYHQKLSHEAFSDDPRVTTRIRRFESFRAWTDIDDLAGGFEKLV